MIIGTLLSDRMVITVSIVSIEALVRSLKESIFGGNKKKSIVSLEPEGIIVSLE